MTNSNAATAVVAPSVHAVAEPLSQLMRLEVIRRNPKVDPRKGRNPARYAQMTESIRAEGVLQPILVRPIAGADVSYEVVFGNTRFDISNDLGLEVIPVLIRDMTDAEARRAAAIENLQRADLTPIEEAYHAVEMLADCNNDHAEVCKALGWSRTKLDSRVLLSKCCDEVAEALVQGHIKLGHAELLAPLTHSDQRHVCGRIIEAKMNVLETKARLSQLSSLIETAPFDTTECKGCQHNSGQYGDLFSASVGEAKCQNRTCWEQKTKELIEVRLIEARQDFGVVHTDMTLPDGAYVLLEEAGERGVGGVQFNACLSCESYGAVVSTKSGQEGRIVGGHCFNKTCHSSHNEAYKALIAAATATTAPATSPDSNGDDDASTGQVSKAAKPASAESNSKAKPQEVKKAIKKEAFSLYARMAAQAIHANRAYTLAVSIVSLYLDMRNELPSELLDRIQKATGIPSSLHGHSRANVEAELAQRSVEELEGFQTQLAGCTVFRRDGSELFQNSVPGAQSLVFIKAAGLDPVDHFKMTEGYLKALTKAGVIADCKASGFDVKYDEIKGAKEFAKLASGKVDDLIKGILAFQEFSWVGYLPEAMKISAHDGSGTA